MSPVQYAIKGTYMHFAAAPVETWCGGKIFAALRGGALHGAGVPRVRQFPARVMALRPLAAFGPPRDVRLACGALCRSARLARRLRPLRGFAFGRAGVRLCPSLRR